MRAVLLTLLLVACGPKAPAPVAAAEEVAPVEAAGESEKVEPAAMAETAPTPFTADQIREGCPPGRRILMRLSKEGSVMWQETLFVGGDEITAEMRGHLWPEGTEPSETIASTESWEVLRDHAAFPKDRTTITADVAVRVPAGDFTTTRYDVVDDEGLIQHFFFATELPGPPVKAVFNDAAGETVMEMVENGIVELSEE
ncbi:MAG: hypothetical protein EP330_25590 [Deltaproteobacteria bacterium]|nr:MAG: hypothetical protein EP330_25590 [Deltaproteobacteria bacterium]